MEIGEHLDLDHGEACEQNYSARSIDRIRRGQRSEHTREALDSESCPTSSTKVHTVQTECTL